MYDLSVAQQIRFTRLEQAPQNRRTRREGSAVTYQDKKDREQAWKLRYERLQVQQKLLAKSYVQQALRRWANAFPAPLKEFVTHVVNLVPGPHKAHVKQQGLEAVANCMSKIVDLARAFDMTQVVEPNPTVNKRVQRKAPRKKSVRTKPPVANKKGRRKRSKRKAKQE